MIFQDYCHSKGITENMKTNRMPVIWFMVLCLVLVGCSSSDDEDGGNSLPACECSSEPLTDEDGVVFLFERQTVEKPANVSVLFKTETDEGLPLTGLTADDFRIYEDGDLISRYESRQAIVPKPGSFTHYGLLLLDLSGSILGGENLNSLKSAAKAFVEAVMPESGSSSIGEIQLEIRWFDGSNDTHLLVPFTEYRDELLTGIDGITGDISDDSSTNLYGAVMEGMRIVNDARRNTSETVSVGSLVMFTDGKDQAARRTEEEARDAVSNADDSISVYTIGLDSEIDSEVLDMLGKDGFVWAGNIEELYGKFEQIASEIRADVNSHYLFEYCSPKRKGQHELRLVVTEKEKSGTLTTCFCADGFEGGCTVAAQ